MPIKEEMQQLATRHYDGWMLNLALEDIYQRQMQMEKVIETFIINRETK